MKTTVLLSLLLAFLFTGCSSVTVKQPAGDNAAALNPELWNAKWRGAGGILGTTRIVDSGKGIIEVKTKVPDEDETTMRLVLREVSGRLVGTAMEEDGKELEFFRLAVSDNHVAIFVPEETRLKEAVEKGTIAGTVRKKDKKENAFSRDETVLERFGAAEADKLGGVLACFEPDPRIVLIRDDKPEPDAAKPEK